MDQMSQNCVEGEGTDQVQSISLKKTNKAKQL